ncbi:hypothetical protein NM688_g3118 [Phlebia brevispora]|uniref:Uncharacterized protein n=1 Tax=Phlebia brevispora TaxID=194682 RepID=A0ACC1T6K8_9APHY|nr:hypothetical protein NM688_g3118 [Phlebia brevispora]
MDCSDFFSQNTDISGIGVRIALYLQVVFLFVQVVLSPEEAGNAFWTLTSMLLGLTIAAIVAAAQQSLSFYNATIVLNLAWMISIPLTMIFIFFSRALRKPESQDWDTKLQYVLLRVVFPLIIILVNIFTAYVWITAYNFGPDAECTPSVKTYFSFWVIKFSFRAIRIIAILFYVVLGALDLVGILWLRYFWDEVLYDKFVNSGSSTLTPAMVTSWMSSTMLLSLLYWIPSIELTLKQSLQGSAATGSQWGFGQILALIAILPSIMSIFFTLVEKCSCCGSRDHGPRGGGTIGQQQAYETKDDGVRGQQLSSASQGRGMYRQQYAYGEGNEMFDGRVAGLPYR